MKWIKVSEALPPLNAKVLVYGKMLHQNVYRIAYRPSRESNILSWKTETGRFLNEITHWSPLLAPPKDNE